MNSELKKLIEITAQGKVVTEKQRNYIRNKAILLGEDPYDAMLMLDHLFKQNHIDNENKVNINFPFPEIIDNKEQNTEEGWATFIFNVKKYLNRNKKLLITIAGLLLLIEIADNINFTGGHNSINNNFVSEPSSTSLYISDVTIGTEGITFSGLSFGDDEQSIKYEKQQTQDQLVAIEPTGQINGYNYVDLGLSVYWALENVGASSYYDDGDYYAWGEIKSKDIYTVDNYFDSKNSTMEYSKYNEYTNILELEDDVAHVIMGDPWRMPTSNEMDELVENCDWSIVETKNGLGMMGTSKINGKNIFLPATGYKSGEKGTSFHRDEAYYRSSMISHNPSLAFCIRIIISRNIIERYNASRESGFTIRAVSSKNII